MCVKYDLKVIRFIQLIPYNLHPHIFIKKYNYTVILRFFRNITSSTQTTGLNLAKFEPRYVFWDKIQVR